MADEPGQVLEEDAGFTLVETMVAIVLVTIALFALMAELTAYVHHQANERRRTTAVRYLTTTLEKARGLTAQNLALVSSNTTGQVVEGVSYSATQVLQRCLVSDPPDQCTTPGANDPYDTRLRVTISWPDGTATRSVSSYTALADTSNSTYRPTGSGTISTLVGGTGQAASGVSVSAFTATPSSTTVTSAGVPTSPITLNLTTVGLNSSTGSIPVTWTDDGGSHQTNLTGGPNSWTVTIPAASISKAVASGTSTLTFAATVPGTRTISTVVTTLRPGVSITSCSVFPNPLVLLLRKTTLAETLSCTVFGLASSDSVTVAYTAGTSTVTKTLTSSNGTSWSVVLPIGSSMASSGVSESFTFTATRASDGLTATSVVTGVLA